MPIKTSLDQLDYQIIKELHTNARISASDIAHKINANERTIRKRIDRLVKDEIIRLTAIINPQAFGYVTAVDIFLEAEQEQEENIIRHLMSLQEVTYIAFGQGSNDLSIEARFKDNDKMRDFLRQTLPAIPGIKVTGYTLVPRIFRNIDEWMPKEEDFGIFSD
jgi:DNA-binding Lrp family transcriptional regulator